MDEIIIDENGIKYIWHWDDKSKTWNLCLADPVQHYEIPPSLKQE